MIPTHVWQLRASTIIGLSPSKCWYGGEKGGERGELGSHASNKLGTDAYAVVGPYIKWMWGGLGMRWWDMD